MLNPFPALLVYGLFAPLIIRVTIGAALFYAAIHHYRGRRETAHLLAPLVGKLSAISAPLLATIEIITAVLLVIGLYTQIAAVLAMVLALKSLMLRKRLVSLMPLSHSTYLLLLVMSFTLLLTGAGIPSLSFDLPL